VPPPVLSLPRTARRCRPPGRVTVLRPRLGQLGQRLTRNPDMVNRPAAKPGGTLGVCQCPSGAVPGFGLEGHSLLVEARPRVPIDLDDHDASGVRRTELALCDVTERQTQALALHAYGDQPGARPGVEPSGEVAGSGARGGSWRKPRAARRSARRRSSDCPGHKPHSRTRLTCPSPKPHRIRLTTADVSRQAGSASLGDRRQRAGGRTAHG
jgi:hypothetical protein